MTDFSSIVQKELKEIEKQTPWFHVESTREIVCPTVISPCSDRKGFLVHILLTGMDSHKSFNNYDEYIARDSSINNTRRSGVNDEEDMIIRVEVVFCDPLEEESNDVIETSNDKLPINCFTILYITHQSSLSPLPVYYDHSLRKSDIGKMQMKMVSLSKKDLPPNVINSDESSDNSDLFSQMNMLRKCLQRPSPLLMLHACLHKQSVPIELCRIVQEYMNSIKFNDTTIRHAVRLWTTQRDIAMSHLGHISTWNTSEVTTMENLFASKRIFNDDITGWDVRNVTDMTGMFLNATSFNQPIDCWQINKNASIGAMFRGASSFNQTLPSWRAKIEEMICGYVMFDYGTRWDILGGYNDLFPPKYIEQSPQSQEEMSFLIRNIRKEELHVTFKRNTTVIEVKEYLSDIYNIPIEYLRVINCYGQNVQNHKYLEDAKIERNGQVYWTPRYTTDLIGCGDNIVVEQSLLHVFSFN